MFVLLSCGYSKKGWKSLFSERSLEQNVDEVDSPRVVYSPSWFDAILAEAREAKEEKETTDLFLLLASLCHRGKEEEKPWPQIFMRLSESRTTTLSSWWRRVLAKKRSHEALGNFPAGIADNKVRQRRKSVIPIPSSKKGTMNSPLFFCCITTWLILCQGKISTISRTGFDEIIPALEFKGRGFN